MILKPVIYVWPWWSTGIQSFRRPMGVWFRLCPLIPSGARTLVGPLMRSAERRA